MTEIEDVKLWMQTAPRAIQSAQSNIDKAKSSLVAAIKDLDELKNSSVIGYIRKLDSESAPHIPAWKSELEELVSRGAVLYVKAQQILQKVNQ